MKKRILCFDKEKESKFIKNGVFTAPSVDEQLSEVSEVEIFPETTIEFVDDDGAFHYSGDETVSLTIGEEYIVCFDGTEYVCTCLDGGGTPLLIDTNDLNNMDCVFSIVDCSSSPDNGSIQMGNTVSAGSHTVGIYQKSTTYTKLPEESIPYLHGDTEIHDDKWLAENYPDFYVGHNDTKQGRAYVLTFSNDAEKNPPPGIYIFSPSEDGLFFGIRLQGEDDVVVGNRTQVVNSMIPDNVLIIQNMYSNNKAFICGYKITTLQSYTSVSFWNNDEWCQYTTYEVATKKYVTDSIANFVKKPTKELICEVSPSTSDLENDGKRYNWNFDNATHNLDFLRKRSDEFGFEIYLTYNAYNVDYVTKFTDDLAIFIGDNKMSCAIYDNNFNEHNTVRLDNTKLTFNVAYATLTNIKIYKVTK